MNYIQLSFQLSPGEERERLIAGLSAIGAEAFEETDERLMAFFREEDFERDRVDDLAAGFNTVYSLEQIPQQNWNAAWENSFEPVTVPGFCTIRAGFHPPDTTVEHEIIITPKMSFGTGHHATTRLMIQAMRGIPFEEKTVLDFGTGTGILAILAWQLKARSVLAIDNDEWSVENAAENIVANDASGVRILSGSLEVVSGLTFDVILANINRHILIQYMADMRVLLRTEGTLVLSGILTEDEGMITAAALENGFKKVSGANEGNWISIIFTV